MNSNVKKLVFIALFSAMAFVLMFVHFPILPYAPFLTIDPSEIPVLIGAIMLGPIAGITIEFLKNMMNIVLAGSSTGGVGELANFIIGVALVVPTAIIYRKNQTPKGYIKASIIGVICMTIAGVIANYFLLVPLYFGLSITSEDYFVKCMIYFILAIIPFNIIKGTLSCALTYLFLKPLSKHIQKFKIK